MATYQDITGLVRVPKNFVRQISIAQYDGQAKPGELLIDMNNPATPVVYVGNVTGNIVGVGGGSITPGANIVANNISSNTVINGNVIISNTGNFVTVNSTTLNSTDINTTNFTANGNVNLGNVGNIKIAGGSNGQFLRTDGAGNLNWANAVALPIANGTSNIDIPAVNGNITLSVGGVANVLSITSSGTALKRYTETVISPQNTGTAITPDLGSGSIFEYVANNSFTFNGFANATPGVSAVVIIKQDAVGGRLMASTMLFAGGQKTLSPAPNAVDVISVFYNGTNYYASLTTGYA